MRFNPGLFFSIATPEVGQSASCGWKNTQVWWSAWPLSSSTRRLDMWFTRSLDEFRSTEFSLRLMRPIFTRYSSCRKPKTLAIIQRPCQVVVVRFNSATLLSAITLVVVVRNWRCKIGMGPSIWFCKNFEKPQMLIGNWGLTILFELWQILSLSRELKLDIKL